MKHGMRYIMIGLIALFFISRLLQAASAGDKCRKSSC